MQSTQSCQWMSFRSFFCASHCFYFSGLRLQVVSKQRDDNLKTEQELRSLKAECDSSMAEAKRVCVFVFVHFFFFFHSCSCCLTSALRHYLMSCLRLIYSLERTLSGPGRLTAAKLREWERRCQSWPASCTSATSPSPVWAPPHPASSSSFAMRRSDQRRSLLSSKWVNSVECSASSQKQWLCR